MFVTFSMVHCCQQFPLKYRLAFAKVPIVTPFGLTEEQKCATISYNVRRHGGIGRHKGLKIPRSKIRTGSIPVSGTINGRNYDTIS